MRKVLVFMLVLLLALPSVFAYPHHPGPPHHGRPVPPPPPRHFNPAFEVFDFVTDVALTAAVVNSINTPDVIYVDRPVERRTLAYDPTYLLNESVSSGGNGSGKLLQGSIPPGPFHASTPIDLTLFTYAYLDDGGNSIKAEVGNGLSFRVDWSLFSGGNGSVANVTSSFTLPEPGIVTITPVFLGKEWSEVSTSIVVD